MPFWVVVVVVHILLLRFLLSLQFTWVHIFLVPVPSRPTLFILLGVAAVVVVAAAADAERSWQGRKGWSV